MQQNQTMVLNCNRNTLINGNQYIQRSLLIFLTFSNFIDGRFNMRCMIEHWTSLDKNKEKKREMMMLHMTFSWAQTKSHHTTMATLALLVLFPLHGNMVTKKPCKKARHILTYIWQSCRLHVNVLFTMSYHIEFRL